MKKNEFRTSKIWFFISIILTFILVIVSCVPNKGIKDTLEVIYYIVFILSIFLIIKQIKMLINQNEINEKEIKMRFNFQKKEKAVELAREFSELISQTSYILSIMEHTSSSELLNKSEGDYECLKLFNVNEVKNIFGLEEAQLKQMVFEERHTPLEKFAGSYFNMRNHNCDIYEKLIILSGNKYITYTETEIEEEQDHEKKRKMNIYNELHSQVHNHLIREYFDVSSELLNKFEYFAMNFMAGIADEDTVYQSLHQVYLRFIKLIYFKISFVNKNGNKDKYYCNIISLYILWAEKFHKKKEEEEKAHKTHEESTKKSQNELANVGLTTHKRLEE